MKGVPAARCQALNDQRVRADGQFVLYWMIANRRSRWNFSLDRAIELALEWNKPLVVLEALRVGYRWASDRIHGFIISGMAENAKQFARHPVTYYPWLEREPGSGKGMLQAFSRHSCAIITDAFPCFFLPHMVRAAANQVEVYMESVDSNGLMPLSATDKVFLRAYDFRRYLQKNLRDHLGDFPKQHPFHQRKLPRLDKLPETITARWPATDLSEADNLASLVTSFPIDHEVGLTATQGGSAAAETAMRTFISERLGDYQDSRNHPERDSTSGLSPYLHFGHLSAHHLFTEVTAHVGWDPTHLQEKATGSSKGWWGTDAATESFLDEMITWREVGYNMCHGRDDYDQFESLPDWAQRTMREHAHDPRPHVYTCDQFARAETHDPLWNAAQNQLVREGRIHNYLRMLWGKKVYEWSASPRDALDTLIELNNRFALDGRNPNSYSGIFWCLGRYDRAWGPERPIFGKLRYMSSENTARKVNVKNYVRIYASPHGSDDVQSRLF